MNNILKMRQKDTEEFNKRREELIKPHFLSTEDVKKLDQSGATFLKISTMPLPSVSQQSSQPVQQGVPVQTSNAQQFQPVQAIVQTNEQPVPDQSQFQQNPLVQNPAPLPNEPTDQNNPQQ